jgi:glycosyltransferase involved in cell wall biosynthesis
VLIDNEQNMGISKSVNRGIDAALGVYLAKMDADDICLPNRFAKQVEWLDEHVDIVAVGSAVYHVDGDNNCLGAFSPPCDSIDVGFALLYTFPFYNPSLMIRGAVLYDNNLRYDEGFVSSAEDYDFMSRLAVHGKMENMPDVLLLFRQHQASVTVQGAEKQRVNNEKVSRRNIKKLLNEELVFGGGNIAVDAHVLQYCLKKYVEKHPSASVGGLKAMLSRHVVKRLHRSKGKAGLLSAIFNKDYAVLWLLLSLPNFAMRRKRLLSQWDVLTKGVL